MSGLDELTIAGVARQFRRGQLTPRELIEQTLAQIESRNGVVNALATVTAEQAVAQADRATAELRAGLDRGPLHGVPVSVKDNIDVAGVRVTAGSQLYADRVPQVDSTVVHRLRAAGAVLLGTANMHELASAAVSAVFGRTRNPRNLDRIPGGSSAGSAAAVAAGMGLASIGTDSGGSVRIPAALCGVVGLKPTYGRVSNAGIRVNYPSFDCAGPITRTVEDCALVLTAIASYDPDDFATVPVPTPVFASGAPDVDLSGVRVGVIRRHFFERCDPQVARAVLAAVDTLAGLGATVADLDVDGLDAAWAADAARPEFGHQYLADVRDRPEAFDPDVLARLHAAMRPSLAEHLTARRASEHVAGAFRRALETIDLVAVPTTPIAAPRIGTVLPDGASPSQQGYPLYSFTRVFNLLRVPALSLPCGQSADGLPIGLQLVGRPFDEATLVRVGRAYEHARLHHGPATGTAL